MHQGYKYGFIDYTRYGSVKQNEWHRVAHRISRGAWVHVKELDGWNEPSGDDEWGWAQVHPTSGEITVVREKCGIVHADNIGYPYYPCSDTEELITTTGIRFVF